jgi:hypothetical protein
MLLTSIRICTNFNEDDSNTYVFNKSVKPAQLDVSYLSLWNILHVNNTLKKIKVSSLYRIL